MHVCVEVNMHVCVEVNMHVCVEVSMHVYVEVSMRVYARVAEEGMVDQCKKKEKERGVKLGCRMWRERRLYKQGLEYKAILRNKQFR